MYLNRYFYFVLAVTAALWVGCAKNQAEPQQSKAAGDTLLLTSDMNARVPVIAVEEQAGRSEISLSGRVDFDPTSVTRVYPLVSGVYDHIYVQQGAHVAQGQVLADVYSPDIASAVSDFQKASTT